MEKNKWANIIMAVIYIALGVIFIIRPIEVGSTLCYILAAAVAALGLLYLLGFFIQRPEADGTRSGNGFVVGILLIVMAAFIVVKQNLVISLVPFLFGVMVTIRGLIGIQSTVIMRRLGKGGLWMFIAGLVTMGLGIFIMMFPFKTAQVLFILIGIGLLIGGLAGIAEEILIRMAIRNKLHAEERARDTADVRDVEYTESAPSRGEFLEEPAAESAPAEEPAAEAAPEKERDDAPEKASEPAPADDSAADAAPELKHDDAPEKASEPAPAKPEQ